MRATLQTLWQAALLWYDKDADRHASTLSYYVLFAIVPLLLLSVTVSSVLYGKAVVVNLLWSWGEVLGQDTLLLLQTAVANLEATTAHFSIPLFGAVFFSGMVIVMINAFTSGVHYLWEIPHQGFIGWVKKCLYSLKFIVLIELYLVLLIGMEIVLRLLPSWSDLLRPLIFILTSAGLFMMAYRVLPWRKLSFRACAYGGVVAAILFAIAKFLVAWYISYTPVPGLFGAAGIVVALLIWIYVTAAVLYYGSTVAFVYERNRTGESML